MKEIHAIRSWSNIMLALGLLLTSNMAYSLEIELESRAQVGGTRGCCFFDDGDLDTLTTELELGNTQASVIGPLGNSAMSWTSVNAREGTLRGYAEAITNGKGNAAASAIASLKEYISVGVPDAGTAFIPFDVVVTMPTEFEVLSGYVVAGVSLTLRQCRNAGCTAGPQVQHSISQSSPYDKGQYSFQLGTALPYDIQYTRYLISAGFSLYTEVLYGGNGDVDAQNDIIDFSGTARLGVVLPEGISYTSDSGVFLSPVPEPNVALIMLAGLAVLAIRVSPRLS